MKNKNEIRYITGDFIKPGQIINLGDSSYEVLTRETFTDTRFVYQVKKLQKSVDQSSKDS